MLFGTKKNQINFFHNYSDPDLLMLNAMINNTMVTTLKGTKENHY